MECSVVICAWAIERWPLLVEGLSLLERQSTPPDEIVVVVDHNDELLAEVRSQFPAIVAVANRYGQGVSGARNTGIEVAGGDLVAFLDDDAVPATEWLECLLSHYRSSDVLGVGGLIVPRWEDGRRPRWFPDEFLWVVGCSYRGLPTRLAPIRNLMGANMSYRRVAFDTVGGFDEGIGRGNQRSLGCDETELGIRVAQRFPNDRVLYDPSARVDHYVPRRRTTLGYFFSRCYDEGLSKTLVVRSVGASSGLSSERTYTLRTLPTGVVTGVWAAVRGDISGLARAATIMAGLAATTAGYVVGRLRPGSML